MKFGYMIQLQMPRPWTETSEREAYANALECQSAFNSDPLSACKIDPPPLLRRRLSR